MVTWGLPQTGGDSSVVQDQLKDVQLIRAGSVVTWGSPETGGDSSTVQEDLKDAQQTQACLGGRGCVTSGQ